MTPQQIEIHRQRFEEIARSKMDIASDGNGHYFLSHVHYMWQGYLLCAENMPEIHLPLMVCEYSTTPVYRKGYNQCISDLKHRLESQGYTVKTL